MDQTDFEGTLVLEKLAELNLVDQFFEAIDSDDFKKARHLMQKAGLGEEAISVVLKMMAEGSGDH